MKLKLIRDFPLRCQFIAEQRTIKKKDLRKWKDQIFKNIENISDLGNTGLCLLLLECSGGFSADDLILKYSSTWKYFSGHSAYPINITSDDPIVEYNTKPHWKGRQLKMRKSLLNHIIRSMNEIEYL